MHAFPKISSLDQFHQAIEVMGRFSYLTERDIFQDFLGLFVELSNSGIGYLHLFDETTQDIKLNVWSDAVLPICTTSHDSHYPLNSAGIWADCVRHRRPVIHNDYSTSASRQGLPKGHFPVIRHMSFPVFKDEQIVAILGLGNAPSEYTSQMVRNIEIALKSGWLALENNLHNLSLFREETFNGFQGQTPNDVLTGMIQAISRALEARDEYTSRHQSNVAFICGKIADTLDFDGQAKFGLCLGALVHDIGKIAIPSQLLTKPGELTSPEYNLLKTHAATGAGFFSGLATPWPIEAMISQHHERMNGTGYPGGLVGDMICLEARIIGIADTYDAMASDRPYRAKIGSSAALTHIKEQRGHGFDPYVVDGFLKCIKENPTFDGRYERP